MSIYVNFKKPSTLKAFLELFFGESSSAAYASSVATYSNIECTVLQCRRHANRSIQDLHECVKTYFPSIGLRTLVSALAKLRPNEKRFYPYYCKDIRRPVIIFYAGGCSYLPNAWRPLLHDIGIHTEKELYNYAG